MVEAIAAIVALLAAILPPLVARWADASKQDRIDDLALQHHSVDELHLGTDRVRQQAPPSV